MFANVRDAVALAEFKYPRERYHILFLFDQSSSHTAKAPDALVANKMNVNPGGQQPKMHDTVYNGEAQRMVDDDGEPKGLRRVLIERKVDITNTNKAQMIENLSSHPDFANEKSIIENYIVNRGHSCMFSPKFHCELNPIEKVWGHAKSIQELIVIIQLLV